MNLYTIGKIVGCFGIKGWLKVQPTTDAPERLKGLSGLFMGLSENDTRPMTVEGVMSNPKSVVLKFRDVNDRTDAENLIGCFLFVDEDHLLKLPEGRHFIHDILGCEVITTDGRNLGTITKVYKMPAQDIWEVRKDNKVQMIPAVKEFIKEVDTKNRKVVIRIIEGLLEE